MQKFSFHSLLTGLSLLFISLSNFSFGQCSVGQTTITFTPSSSIEQFVVPNGVTSINMSVKGADGGNTTTFNGGTGTTSTATFSVTTGETLDIVVGIAGGSSDSITIGGGGGGGSGVRRNLSSSILIVGSGGAGAGQTSGGSGGFGALTSLPNPNFPFGVFGANSFGDPNFFGNSITVPGGFGVGGGTWGYSFDNIGIGGGSGGYIVGPPGSQLGGGGLGGISFIDDSGLNQSIIVGESSIGSQSNGVVTFCFDQPASTPVREIENTEIRIFPNPVTNFLNITTNSNENDLFGVRIFDLKGQNIISNREFWNSISIDLNGQTSNVYLLEITDLRTEKSIIEKIEKIK